MATSAWEGWVFKHGSIFPTWKKMYMVQRGTQLVYYDKEASHPKAREKGVFQLANAARDKNVKNGFILTSSDGKRARIYLSTSEESTACLSAMNHALHPPEPKRRQSTETRNHAGWLGMDGKGTKKWYFVLAGIDLSNYERVNGPEIGRGRLADILLNERRNAFTFVFTNGRQLPVAAESEAEAQEWYRVVCTALNKPPTRMAAQQAPRMSMEQQQYGRPSSRELDAPNRQVPHEEPHRASTRHAHHAPVANHLPSPTNERANTPEVTPTRNYTSPNPEVAPARASTPPKPEATPVRASTPPKPEAAPTRVSTPPRPEATPARSSTPPRQEAAPARASTPPRPETVPTRGGTPPKPDTMPPRAPTPPKQEASKAEAIGLPPKPSAPIPRPAGFAPKPLYKPPRAPTPVVEAPKEVDHAQFANKAAEIWNLTDPTLVQAWVEHGKSKPVAVPEPPTQQGPKLQSFLDKYMRVEEEAPNHTTQTSL